MPRSAQKKNGLVPVKSDIAPMKYERPSFAQTFKEGLAFGAGSSIAQTVIRSIGSPATVEVKEVKESKEYKQCMTDNNDDKAACAHLL